MEKSKKKIICFVIFSRANYGSIKSVIKKAYKDKKFIIKLIAGASAVSEKYGSVINQIKKDGFKVNYIINNLVEEVGTIGMVKTTGVGMIELASILDKIKPDFVFTVGDRYETISTAITSSYMNIPVAHTMGGEVSGTIDESVRHAVTKLSNIHFVANQDALKRVLKLGERKNFVFNVGCPRIDEVRNVIKKNDIDKMFRELNTKGVGTKIKKNDKFIMVSFHPVTTEFEKNEQYIKKILNVVNKFNCKKIIFWPNSDAGSAMISKIIRSFREKNFLSDCRFIKNLSVESYSLLMDKALCIVGNSSSALREGAFIGIPAINIGSRQFSRLKGKNIIDVSFDEKKIYLAIEKQIKHGKYKTSKIYGSGFAADKIIKILKKINLTTTQKTITY